MSDSKPVDKEYLYGDFRKRQRWQDALHKKAAHKALDIPEDEMSVNVVKNGWGWRELLVAGTLAMGATYLATRPSLPPPANPGSPPAVEDRDTTRGLAIEKYVP